MHYVIVRTQYKKGVVSNVMWRRSWYEQHHGTLLGQKKGSSSQGRPVRSHSKDETSHRECGAKTSAKAECGISRWLGGGRWGTSTAGTSRRATAS